MGPGSVVPPTPGMRRSTRSGRGLNGRDAQLGRLGDVLVAPTRQAQKRFAPTDGLSLPDNVLAPVQKKRRRNKKVSSNILIYYPALKDRKATLPPPTIALHPRQESLPNIDPRLGFSTPRPPPTPSSPIRHHEAPAQLPSKPSYVTRHSSPQPFENMPLTYPPPVYIPPPSASLSPDPSSSDPEESDTDGEQNHELDIDERSDDEDDRVAHELLRATPMVAQGLTSDPTLLPYNHQGFAVSWFTCCHLTLNYIILPSCRNSVVTTPYSRHTMHGTGHQRLLTHPAFAAPHLSTCHHQGIPTTLLARSTHIHPNGRRSSATQNRRFGHTSPAKTVFPMQSKALRRPESTSRTHWLFIVKGEAQLNRVR